MTAEPAKLALRQLTEIANALPGGLEVLDVRPAKSGPTAEIEVSLNLTGLTRAAHGAQVHDYERFIIEVGPNFPYQTPTVRVPHGRWVKVAHVQWGRQLCLYASPSVEWSPADGMRGLIERLLVWVEKAALGDLDPDDQPLHPPTAYTGTASEFVVVHADLGDRVPWTDPPGGPNYLVAICERRGERFDIIEWSSPVDLEQDTIAATRPANPTGRICAAAILVDTDLGFEYPTRADVLAAGLRQAGVTHEAFLDLLATVATANGAITADEPSAPIMVIIGTPHRRLTVGPRLAHLVAWRLDGAGEQIADLMARTNARRVRAAGGRQRGRAARVDQFGLPHVRAKILELGESWLTAAEIDWLRVMENRPEVTVRRDTGSAATWLAAKRILVLGCGALGAPVAEHCLRAGAATVIGVDNSIVTPGILVRQPYTDADIGIAKAIALANRLKAIRPSADIDGWVADAVTLATDQSAELASFDLIIDATADAGVRAALEAARMTETKPWPTVLTLLIGHQARRGLVAIARPEATGCGHDIFRRLGLTICAPHQSALADIANDFYPDPPRAPAFQPEPGCSTPTFTGSAAEVTALASTMISATLDAICGHAPGASRLPMTVAAVRLDPTRTTGWVGWDNDMVVTAQPDGLQVRISRSAQAEIRAEARRGSRVRGTTIETGGTLIGALDEAIGCVFVDAAIGPPPDSRLSEVYFEHGTTGTQQVVDHHVGLSRGANGFVGMWHTHPGGPAAPSPTDREGMASLVTPVEGGPTQALMLIFGGLEPGWTAWRDTAGDGAQPDIFAELVRRANPTARPARSAPLVAYHPGGYGQHRQPAPTGYRWWRRLLRVIGPDRR